MDAYQLIQRAIQAYYTPEQWLLIMLKNQWQDESIPGKDYRRYRLNLHRYVTIDVNPYNNQHLVQVYIGVSTNHVKRPKWLSTLINTRLGHEHITNEINQLLTSANSELIQLQRGMNNIITLNPNSVIDVTNQLPNDH